LIWRLPPAADLLFDPSRIGNVGASSCLVAKIELTSPEDCMLDPDQQGYSKLAAMIDAVKVECSRVEDQSGNLLKANGDTTGRGVCPLVFYKRTLPQRRTSFIKHPKLTSATPTRQIRFMFPFQGSPKLFTIQVKCIRYGMLVRSGGSHAGSAHNYSRFKLSRVIAANCEIVGAFVLEGVEGGPDYIPRPSAKPPFNDIADGSAQDNSWPQNNVVSNEKNRLVQNKCSILMFISLFYTPLNNNTSWS
jgi:hypothetical protein